MSGYEGFIGVILFTAVTFALIGVVISAIVVTFIALRSLWGKDKHGGDGA